jgi:branched-chain amino acid transport system ATP-binding protein
MLEASGLEVGYTERMVLKGLDFKVEEGEVVALLGANGAGKTTLLRTIIGLMRPKKGRIIFQGEDITRTPTHKIVTRGISLAPEGRQIFSRLSVKDNLRLGAYIHNDKKQFQADLNRVFDLLPLLRERMNQTGGSLSGGEQQMLAIGRALMSRPKLLLLDEPSLGLAPLLVAQLYKIVLSIHEQGTTVLLVEQNARMALGVARHAYVLETGKLVLGGAAKELAEDDRVRKAYLGEP